VNFVITPRARAQVERARLWWGENRDKAPGLLVQELAEAEQHLMTLPESGPVWRIRGKQPIRRWMLEKTAYHLYYVYRPHRQEVLVLAVWSARRGRQPKL